MAREYEFVEILKDDSVSLKLNETIEQAIFLTIINNSLRTREITRDELDLYKAMFNSMMNSNELSIKEFDDDSNNYQIHKYILNDRRTMSLFSKRYMLIKIFNFVTVNNITIGYVNTETVSKLGFTSINNKYEFSFEIESGK